MPGPMPPHHPGSGVVPNPPGMPAQNMPHTMPDGRPLDHGRHTPYFGQPDYRIYEMNKRLQLRTEDSDNLWWDTFATEFFEDDATLTLTFCLEDGPKRYTIGRTLIPRYFRSIFEGGVTDLYYNLKHPKESFHNTTITLDCDQCSMVTHHGKPMYNKGLVGSQYPNDPMKEQMARENAVVVCTEGRLILEFTFDDLMRIKSWHFATRAHRELVPRSVVAMQTQQQDPSLLEQLSKNITRQGLTNSTLNYLRLCVILEPMQELMSRHKAYALSPRDCLKTTLFQKWQRMVAPPETQRPPSKRRKRKSSAANSGTGKKKNIASPGPANFSLASQDVMVVGEPSLMGGEFGDEDERLITRLENTQYDASSAAANGLEDGEDYSSNPINSVSSSNASAMSTWSGPHTGGAGQDRNSTSTGGGGTTTNGPQSSKQDDKKSSPSISQ
ncbi:LIM domain-binding protein 2-like isoform X2 [Tachypleus tridentatus]|uniref:LIM domain-binding protein 2-like isoform X2 n=1 Tax=Tachypleus tridentatus TaxID=6853 RepID=UPI003FD54C27